MEHSTASLDISAARLAGLLDSAMDGIITVDAQQRIVLYNRAAEALFGWSAADVLGQPLEMLLPERFRKAHHAQVQQFGHTGVTSRRMGDRTVLYGLHRNAAEFPLEASISQLTLPEGKLYTVILRDITERVRAQHELAAYAAAVSSVREQEKARVARELHDELAQTLAVLKMDALWLQQMAGHEPTVQAKLPPMLQMLDAAVAATRRIAADLRPLILDDLGLVPALEWLAQTFTQRHAVACELSADDDMELAEPYATAVFRIVQESLNNVAKHANASHVWVQVDRQGNDITVSIRDDGQGFEPQQPRKQQSLGLAGLRERAQALQGQLQLHSQPGQGTDVRVCIPFRNA